MFQHSHETEGQPRKARLFWGGLLLAAGLLALSREFGVQTEYGFDRMWPTALFWFGIVQFLPPSNVFTGLIGIAGGALGFLHTMTTHHLRWEVVWPVLLVVLGLKTLFVKGGRRKRWERRMDYGSQAATGSGSRLSRDLVMTGLQDSFEGRDFEGGDIRVHLAGYELDLRGANMVGERVELVLSVRFGGVEIRVPRGWRVENDARAMIGAVESHVIFTPNDEGVKTLVLRGDVFFGGVEIKN